MDSEQQREFNDMKARLKRLEDEKANAPVVRPCHYFNCKRAMGKSCDCPDHILPNHTNWTRRHAK